jgi:hypothetical protein
VFSRTTPSAAQPVAVQNTEITHPAGLITRSDLTNNSAHAGMCRPEISETNALAIAIYWHACGQGRYTESGKLVSSGTAIMFAPLAPGGALAGSPVWGSNRYRAYSSD